MSAPSWISILVKGRLVPAPPSPPVVAAHHFFPPSRYHPSSTIQQRAAMSVEAEIKSKAIEFVNEMQDHDEAICLLFL